MEQKSAEMSLNDNIYVILKSDRYVSLKSDKYTALGIYGITYGRESQEDSGQELPSR